MANFEAYAKQDSRVGKWGYFYSYTDEQTLIGKAGQSGYIFDSKEDAEKAIEDLQVELSEWAKKEFEKKLTGNLILGVALLVAIIFATKWILD